MPKMHFRMPSSRHLIHLKNFDGGSRLSNCLTRIAINSALTILRKKRAHPETSIHNGLNGTAWEAPDLEIDIEESVALIGTVPYSNKSLFPNFVKVSLH
jgi:DNA-directed RNA polymerase specialized sigma24 family protein